MRSCAAPRRSATGSARSGRTCRRACDNEVVINRGAASDGHLHVGDVTTVDTPAPVRVHIVGIATFGTEKGLGTATYSAFSLAGAERYLAGPTGGIQAILVHAQP